METGRRRYGWCLVPDNIWRAVRRLDVNPGCFWAVLGPVPAVNATI